MTLPPAGTSGLADSSGEPVPVRGVGREDRYLAGAGRQVDRTGVGARLEVVEGPLAVDVDVDGGVGNAVHDVHGAGLLGRCERGGGKGGRGGGEQPAEGHGQASHGASFRVQIVPSTCTTARREGSDAQCLNKFDMI